MGFAEWSDRLGLACTRDRSLLRAGLADRRRAGSGAHRPRLRRPAADVRRVRRAGRAARGRAARGRARARRQGRDHVRQRARVHGDVLRRAEARMRPGQRQLPLRRRRARVPARQLRFGRARVPRRLRRDCRRCARRAPRRTSSAGAAASRAHRRHHVAARRPRLRRQRSPQSTRSEPATTRDPSGDDLVFLYTGGTTGYPKAVMWRSDDLYVSLWQMARPGTEPPDVATAINAGKQAARCCPRARSCTAPDCSSRCRRCRAAGRSCCSTRRGSIRKRCGARSNASTCWCARSSATRSPARCSARSKPNRTAGISRRCGRSRRRVSRGAPRPSADCSRCCPTVTLIDSLGASEGIMTAHRDPRLRRHRAGAVQGRRTPRRRHRRRRRRAPRRRTGRHARRRRTDPARLLQGSGEDRGDLPHRRGPALFDPRRLRDRRSRRDHPASRAGLGVHQHGRREGLSRRGRARAPRPSRRLRLRRRRASPTIAGARWWSRSCNPRCRTP